MLPAAAQDQYWHRVSGTFGAFVPAAGSQTSGFGNAPVISFDYGFRFHRYGQWDAGVDAAFASRLVNSRGDDKRRTSIYLPRTGYSLIVPLWRDRIEAIAGAGAGYSFFKPAATRESWLVYFQGGANYAIDFEKKYRAGMMVRWYRDPVGSPQQQWVSVGAQFSYSF
jgi:hypothetical protein